MPISLTICIGVATFTEGMSGFDNLLRNADSALYDAKNSGRNQVKKYKMNSNEISGLSSGLDDE
jgi:diguanylate cyclase (GGDEF)-like protein